MKNTLVCNFNKTRYFHNYIVGRKTATSIINLMLVEVILKHNENVLKEFRILIHGLYEFL